MSSYAVVEALPEVADSVVVHLQDRDGGSGELILLVVLQDGVQLDEAVRSKIAGELRAELSPRHVPNTIHAVSALPRTLTGKKLEVPIKRVLSGEDPDDVTSRDAITNPDSLDDIRRLARHAI